MRGQVLEVEVNLAAVFSIVIHQRLVNLCIKIIIISLIEYDT